MSSYLNYKAQPVWFNEWSLVGVTISLPELSLPCAACSLPWRMRNSQNPGPRPHTSHTTQMPAEKHRLRCTGFGAVLLHHYSQNGWGSPPFHVLWFTRGLLQTVLFQIRSCLSPFSILWAQTRNQKSTPEEWRITSEQQELVGTYCSFGPSVGKPQACSTHSLRVFPVGLSPHALAGTHSFTLNLLVFLPPLPLTRSLCSLGSPLKETTGTKILYTGLP